MAKTLEVGGYHYVNRQAEANYRLNLCMKNQGKGLYHFYKNPSEAKWYAWHSCERMAAAAGALSHVCVTGGNCMVFTASFYTTNPETGEITRVFWITKWGAYYAEV